MPIISPLLTSKLISFSAQNSSFGSYANSFCSFVFGETERIFENIGQDIAQSDITASLMSDVVFLDIPLILIMGDI